AGGAPDVVRGRPGDADLPRAHDLGPRQRKGQKDRVARGHIGDRDPGRELGGGPVFGDRDFVREGGPAEPPQVEFDDLVPGHVEGAGDTTGGRNLDLVALAV